MADGGLSSYFEGLTKWEYIRLVMGIIGVVIGGIQLIIQELHLLAMIFWGFVFLSGLYGIFHPLWMASIRRVPSFSDGRD